MPLEIKQIKQRVKEPKNQRLKSRAIYHENLLRFHTEVFLNRNDTSQGFNIFAEYVKRILPENKYNLFLNLFSFPVVTNEICEKVFNFYTKIFDTKDPFYDYSFSSTTYEDDFLLYKEKSLPNQYWENIAFEVMKSNINSVQIIDLPVDQNSEFPEPYHYFRTIESILDFTHEKGEITSLMYLSDDKTKLFVYDDQFYRTFEVSDNKEINLISEFSHNLGYCPVRFFWSNPLNSVDVTTKKFEVTNQLSGLNNHLLAFYQKEHLDLSSAFPIYYGLEVQCNYENVEMGHTCQKGKLIDNNGNYIFDGVGKLAKCPACHDKRIAGAGTYIEMPFPKNENEQKVFSKPPIGKLDVDASSLKYHTDKVKVSKEDLYQNMTGDNSILPNQAVNKFQIGAMTDKMKTNLLRVQKNFERAQKWAESTICKLRYGDNFKDCSISYGTEYFLFSTEYLIEIYQKSKDSGVSETYLDSLQDEIIEVQHKNNPKDLNRAKILLSIEPYRHQTKKEVIEGFRGSPDLYNTDLVKIKINFSNLVTRFESEFSSIDVFGYRSTTETKIKFIKKTLLDYVREHTGSRQGTSGEK